jgi:hypothetical protein
MLLNKGAEISAESKIGTALECASFKKNITPVELLESYGAE